MIFQAPRVFPAAEHALRAPALAVLVIPFLAGAANPAAEKPDVLLRVFPAFIAAGHVPGGLSQARASAGGAAIQVMSGIGVSPHKLHNLFAHAGRHAVGGPDAVVQAVGGVRNPFVDHRSAAPVVDEAVVLLRIISAVGQHHRSGPDLEPTLFPFRFLNKWDHYRRVVPFGGGHDNGDGNICVGVSDGVHFVAEYPFLLGWVLGAVLLGPGAFRIAETVGVSLGFAVGVGPGGNGRVNLQGL